MVKRNIITDFTTYSKLSASQAEQLISLLEYFICDAVLEAQAKEEDILTLNLGVSTLTINTKDGSWKSAPSETMVKKFADMRNKNSEPLADFLAENISKKLFKILGE